MAASDDSLLGISSATALSPDTGALSSAYPSETVSEEADTGSSNASLLLALAKPEEPSGADPIESIIATDTDAAEESAADEEAEKTAEAPVQSSTKKGSRLSRLFSFAPAKPTEDKTTETHVETAAGDTTSHAARSSDQGEAIPLPGVRLEGLFGIEKATDEDAVQFASAGGLARLAPHGITKQSASVETACFRPELVSLLRRIGNHYGKEVVVTSGYRSHKHNRRVGGASASRHMTCEAADIHIEGVSKRQLAAYVRSLPGRGGVGTYCHTNSIHVDVGTQRDWNRRCRK